MINLLKFSLFSAAMLTSSACAGLKQFTAQFESRFDDPTLFEETLNPGENAVDEQLSLALIEAGIVDYENCDNVRKASKQALTLKPEAEWPIVAMAECDLYQGDAKGALVVLNSLNTLKDEPRVLVARGKANVKLANYTQAIAELNRALELSDTNLWEAWNALGIAHDMLNQHKDATDAFMIASEINPGSGIPLNNVGMSYLQQGESDKAISAFHYALKKEPELSAARLNLRIAYAMEGDYDKAVTGASEDEKASVYNNAGVAAMRRGEYDRARHLFQKALNESPVFYAVAYHNLERLPR